MRDLVEGWQAFVEHTWVWLLSAWIAVFFLISYAPFFVLGPYLAEQEMGGAGAWATVLTGEAIGSLLGGLAALRLRPARPMLVCVLVFTLVQRPARAARREARRSARSRSPRRSPASRSRSAA